MEITPEDLLRLAVPHEDVNPVLAGVPKPGSDARREIDRYVSQLADTMGRLDEPPGFPDEAATEFGPYFYVYVYLAAAPYTRAYHRERGIPEEVSWATLTDLGRHMAMHRRRYGTPGLHAPWWHARHFSGLVYALGRLQFDRARLGEELAAGAGRPAGEPVLAVHIPDFAGPMSPEACDASYAQARKFFPQHFPEEPFDLAICISWLLDEQLADYLPEESNIVAFQRRFRPAYLAPDNAGLISFIYGTDLPPDDLPRRTALERAVADHLAAGKSWNMAGGYHEL
ncbi:acyltransferase domain-containing protein [Planotetraspora sp. GP83]|uniref:acyltransferase domain-containing protein n=1 Tax=Planotetraspora sp. GP83 TaxID=3156264 RepID=UPI003514B782